MLRLNRHKDWQEDGEIDPVDDERERLKGYSLPKMYSNTLL